jgi:hypothetical protein
MLKPQVLEQQLKDMFNQTIPVAFERAFLELFPEKTDAGDKQAKQFAKTIDDLLSEQWAKTIAQAIDYYVKNAQIFGTIITAGSPTSQVAVINSTPVPVTNGAIPNTLGIK